MVDISDVILEYWGLIPEEEIEKIIIGFEYSPNLNIDGNIERFIEYLQNQFKEYIDRVYRL